MMIQSLIRDNGNNDKEMSEACVAQLVKAVDRQSKYLG